MSQANRRVRSAVAFAICLLLACASPEEQFAERVARAEKLAADEETDEAILEYRSALEINPESAEANEKLGELLLRKADMSATFYLSEAIRIDPSRVDLAMRLARVLLVSDQVDSAEDVINAALQTHPDAAIVHSTRAEMLLYRNDPDGALEAATRATELAPEDPDAWFQLGRVHQGHMRMANLEGVSPRAGIRRDAIAAFERADELADGYVMARVERARLIGLRDAQFPQAKEVFTEAVDLAKEQGDRTLRFVAAEAAADFATKKHKRQMRIWAIREMLAADDSRLDLWNQLVDIVDASSKMGIAIYGELLRKRPDDVNAHLALVTYLQAAGQPKQAMAHLRDVLALDLGSPLPWEQMVRLQMQRGRLANARATFVRMSDEFPDDPVTNRTEARIALVEGRVEDAVEILRQLETGPPDFEVQRLLALAEYRMGDLARAADAVRRALAMRGGFAPEAMRLKARIHHDSEEWGATLRTLSALQKRGYEIAPEYQLMGARALYGLGRSEQGREVILKLLAEEKPPIDAAVEYARREGAQNPMEAARYLGLALKRDSTNADALAALVTIQLRAGNAKPALNLLNQAISSGKAKPATLLLRARVLTKVGDLDRAEADALRAFEAEPSLPGGVELLYAIYKAQGRLDEARKSFEEAEAAGVLHSGARLLLGRIYSRQGDMQRARQMLERVLRDDPTAVGAKNDLAYLLAQSDTDLDRAVKLAEDAQHAMTKSPNTADTLGFVYLRKGLNEAALHQFRYALQLDGEQPSDIAPTLHYHLGLTLHALERNEEAADAFEKALALDSDFPEAGEARRQLEKAHQPDDGSTRTS